MFESNKLRKNEKFELTSVFEKKWNKNQSYDGQWYVDIVGLLGSLLCN